MKNWSRKRKLLLCILLLLISLVFIGSLSNWRSPTLEIALHRAEKQQLIGPSEILVTLDFIHSPADHIVLGETQFGYTIYEYSDDLGWDNGYLRYFGKTDNATVFCTDYAYRTNAEDWLPIFVFPEKQKAVSAKMTLSIANAEASESYQLDAEKTEVGYFLFSLPTEELEAEFYWLLQQAITGAWQEYIISGTVDIQIEFYDRSGNLTDTYTKHFTK